MVEHSFETSAQSGQTQGCYKSFGAINGSNVQMMSTFEHIFRPKRQYHMRQDWTAADSLHSVAHIQCFKES